MSLEHKQIEMEKGLSLQKEVHKIFISLCLKIESGYQFLLL